VLVHTDPNAQPVRSHYLEVSIHYLLRVQVLESQDHLGCVEPRVFLPLPIWQKAAAAGLQWVTTLFRAVADWPLSVVLDTP